MTDDLLLGIRERLQVGERTFAVFGEPWFDPQDREWKGRLLFLPLDRSSPRGFSTRSVRRARRRGDLIASLRALGDGELRRAARTLFPPAPGSA